MERKAFGIASLSTPRPVGAASPRKGERNAGEGYAMTVNISVQVLTSQPLQFLIIFWLYCLMRSE
ncbi:hypothetical protein Cal7507_2034 [Calothrix sp. PCC 7507]|nr:hypothetical protein Cal7507_2034 [Calothrix sp. PCC 7507]